MTDSRVGKRIREKADIEQGTSYPITNTTGALADALPRYTLRISAVLLNKVGYIAEYEGRTKNKEIEQILIKRVREFEKEHGPIECE